MRDEGFVRGEIPMTKEEVRAVSLSRMELAEDSVIYDIGAGTGSVTVEAALTARRGYVYAFEQKEEGCRLIRSNCRKFHVDNVTVAMGRAPECLKGYPAPDRVFIGGSSGELERILDLVFLLNPLVRVVVNVIALETLGQVLSAFQKRGLEAEIVCVQASRAQAKGRYHLMQAQNPVYVVSAGEGKRAAGRMVRQPDQIRGRIPGFLLAAPASGSGKTVITSGLLVLLSRRGLSCVSFKCGPDYIDPMFHRYVLGIPGCNLDSFFLEKEKLSRLFEAECQGADMAVIEGVMGYYDGVDCTSWASAYDVARITDVPVVLVLDGRKSSLSLAAELKGFREYKKDSRIAGVILNRTTKERMETMRPYLEEQGVVCIGAVPQCQEAELESRHLGLTLPGEQRNLRERLEKLADRMAASLDLELLLELAGGRATEPEEKRRLAVPAPTRKMAVARDEAFCFYYRENLDFLREHGWELLEFSPLRDERLPEGVEAILLGGGYPEVYAHRLSKNTAMLEQIREAHNRGIKILAECGGFLYLHDTLEGADGMKHSMVGLIHGKGFRTDRLQRFGYVTLTGESGTIRGHEFHYWDSTDPGADMQAKKPVSEKQWSCMHVRDGIAAGFPHLYYMSSPEWVLHFLGEEKGR